MANVSFALMVVLCVSCSGLPLLEARALHGQNPTNKAQIERIEELLKVRAGLQHFLALQAVLACVLDVVAVYSRQWS
jgi:hypothetical protein